MAGIHFDDIAPHYDFLNHFLSLHIDKRWRKKSLEKYIDSRTGCVLDVACGTGDFAIDCSKAGAKQVIGVDVSSKMVELGNRKIVDRKLAEKIDLRVGDCANLEFSDEKFDAVIVAFGVRNFEEREKSLCEIFRVLRSSGRVIILEFSMPKRFPIRQLYSFYFKHILPFIGGLISGNKAAYVYLPDSVCAFPAPDDFMDELRQVGFGEVAMHPFSFGIAVAYYGIK